MSSVTLQTDDAMMNSANDVKELVLDTLARDGVISQEQADYYKAFYAVVNVRRGMLGRTIDRLLGLSDSSYSTMVMKTQLRESHAGATE